MGMVLMVDSLCTRYHCLPSEALARATTVDLYYLTNSLGYYNRKRENQTNNLGALPQNSPEPEDLAAIYALSKKV
jgi:hypothetical protein